MLRSLSARLALVLGAAIFLTVIPWVLGGGLVESLTRRSAQPRGPHLPRIPDELTLGPLHLGGPIGGLLAALVALVTWPIAVALRAFSWAWGNVPLFAPAAVAAAIAFAVMVVSRWRARRARRYVRLRITPFRSDEASPASEKTLMEDIHRQVLVRWWQRLLTGQPSVALEIMYRKNGASNVREAALTVSCLEAQIPAVRSAITSCYPHTRVSRETGTVTGGGYVLRLKKRHDFIRRIKVAAQRDHDEIPTMDRVLTALGDVGEPALVQLALTPTPAWFDWYAGRKARRAEDEAAEGGAFADPRTHRPSRAQERQFEGGLDIQHHGLFFADIRIVSSARPACENIAAALRASAAENRLIERGTSLRHGRLDLYRQRVARGEGNPLPSWEKGVFSSSEIASLWHYPSLAFSKVPLHRSNTPNMPAPPGAYRPKTGRGLFHDEHGPISFHVETLSQNVKIIGAVEQGKTSTIVSGIEEDLARGGESVILFDPKGDAAETALTKVPADRRVTYIDLAMPMVGFNPMWVPGVAADTVADYILEAMRNLFDEGDIKASSDRYLRNAIIAVKHFEGEKATLWHVAKVLSVSDQGTRYRRQLGEELAHLPEIQEIVEFFRSELRAQLKDSTQTTTAKLDAPANKLARFLNSESIKRVLRETGEVLDFDHLIRNADVLIVRGALGRMGAGNTAVVMQLLHGMLDAALSRQQDDLLEDARKPVNYTVDEAWLVFNRQTPRTMALKRSAKLRTRAAWQNNAQWTDRDVLAQFNGLFAHHIWCATPSAADAREAIDIMMADYTDSIRVTDAHSRLRVTPDYLLNLPRYEQAVSSVTTRGRLQPYFVRTNRHEIEPSVNRAHLQRQWDRQTRHGTLDDWLRLGGREGPAIEPAAEAASPPVEAVVNGIAGQLMFPGVQPPAPADPASTTSRSAPKRGPGTPAVDTRTDPSDDETEPSTAVAAPRSTPESMLELAALDMMVSIRHGRPSTLPRAIEQAILAGLAATDDRSMTISQVRSGWFAKRSTADAVRALTPMVDAGWLNRITVEADERRVDGYVLTAAGASVLNAATAAGRDLDPTDLEILAWLAEMRVAFSTQIARRWYPKVTRDTLNRYLRKLFDAGLVSRFQFTYDNGGGSPACYVVTDAGLAAAKTTFGPRGTYLNPRSQAVAPDLRDPAGRSPRHDLHVSGWMLALIDAFDGRVTNVRGPQSAHLPAPRRRARNGWIPLGPDDIHVLSDDGAFLHSFKSTDGNGRLVAADSFRSITPDAAAELQLPGSGNRRQELLVEVDLTERPSKQRGKFERFDHFLTGWWTELDRYRTHMGLPFVVFVAVNQEQVLQFVAAADEALIARLAVPGTAASTWRYPARDRMLFVAEADIHAGSLDGLRVPALPIDVREQLSDGTRAGIAAARVCRPRSTNLRRLLEAHAA
ncbi:replication-relaxation family protein [Conexibacter sp. JD483]|uniref:replication-relaxation family protein n=1 Tax=unclassified Conexibacter TaxID=2627773 RepID=UPI002721457C|nr:MULTISPECIES: replication-relaxation family protein [unclassified Conexibacter]MDO8185869.1 replication-relaxation family protein [Conexibacter sp. CPCC 205706]MDO8198612.1 replication-relaxation family protein [Conexibacter sp. CPCC 205762]MDR9367698.1 replication-relaxation family protein [Conexibacter sp. JD483]